jgi:hypothetical protein
MYSDLGVPRSRALRHLANEIELLAPAISRETYLKNCEYPWSDGLRITTPTNFSFFSAWRFSKNAFPSLYELLGKAAEKCLS